MSVCQCVFLQFPYDFINYLLQQQTTLSFFFLKSNFNWNIAVPRVRSYPHFPLCHSVKLETLSIQYVFQEVWFAISLLFAFSQSHTGRLTVTSWCNSFPNSVFGSLCRLLWTSYTCTSPRPSTTQCSKLCWDTWSCAPAMPIPSSRRCSIRTCAR